MKRTTLKFLLPFLMLGSTATMVHASAVQPDPDLSHYLSSSGPLSVEEMQKVKAQKAYMPRASNKSSSSTYTYLRCFYRTSTSNTQPTTNYVWGIDPSSGGYYRVNGYWQSTALVDWQNIFYTSTTQATLQSVCQSTLNNQKITGAFSLAAAADNSMSYNYQIWSNDSSASQGNTINKIVAFGDSLSDNHNLYNLSDWIIPDSNSWFLGRFSNGNNWVEYVGQNLNLPVYDWAVGDAGVDVTDLVIPSLVEEEQSWASDMQSAQNYQAANTLFTVLIGANDIKSGDATVAQVVTDETQVIQSLISSGAKNILVLNLPDISRAPVYSIISGGSTAQAEVLQLNSQLVTMVSNLRSQYGVNIQLFDTYTLFNTVLANPSAYGVTNTTNSCLNINSDSSLNYAETQSPRSICTNADTFVFWDTLHPTTHTHKVLAQYVTSFIQQNFGNVSTAAVKK